MITSLSEDVGRTHRRQAITPLDVAYHQLNEFIEKINEKISNRLQLVQQVYLEDYKDQTNLMREELTRLRANLDAEIMLQRSNQKMLLLEEERDFFRAQVLKLNTEVNHFVDQNKALKKKIADIEVQTANYKTISMSQEVKIKKLQKELNQMANFKRQASAPALPQFRTIDHSADREEPVASEANQQTVTSHVNLFQRVAVRPAKPIRARSQSKHETATKASIRRYQQFNGRDLIIDDCIKEVKKEIFYRTHQHKGLNNSPFEQFGKVPFDRFTRTDKKQLVQTLMTNEKILEEFNQYLLSRNSQTTTTSRMLRTKVGDERFNQKFLSELKRSFGKKIYDLKANPDTFAFSRAAMKKKGIELD